MNIGKITINSRLALAPMAGVTDLGFRTVCRDGSSIVVDGGNGFSDFGPDGQGGRDYFFYGVHAFDAPIPLDQIDHIQFGAYKLLLPE